MDDGIPDNQDVACKPKSSLCGRTMGERGGHNLPNVGEAREALQELPQPGLCGAQGEVEQPHKGAGLGLRAGAAGPPLRQPHADL